MKKLVKLAVILSLFVSLIACSNKTETVETKTVEEEVYRSIAVATIDGNATVKHADGQELQAYEGMLLYDGDDVMVSEGSSLVLNVDSDKHLFAEENAHFLISAEGTEDNNQTKIHLIDGAVLCQLQEKLKDGESFDIETSSGTMCVRGTVFRVSMMSSEDKTQSFEMVEVYDGKVWSNITETENEVTLEPGQCALIKDGNENVGASYVTADQLDEDFWNSADKNIQLKNEESTGSAVLSIAYNKLPSKVVDNLVTITESGQELSLTKDELTQLSAAAVENEAKAGVETKEVPKGILNENEFRGGSLNDDICAQYGHTIIRVNGVRQCSICGRQFSDEYVETDNDKRNAEEAKNSGMPMDIKLPGPIHIEIEVPYTPFDTDESEDPEKEQEEPNQEPQGGSVPVSQGGSPEVIPSRGTESIVPEVSEGTSEE